MTRRTLLTTFIVYAAAAALVVGFVVVRVKTRNTFAAAAAPEELPYGGRAPVPPDEHAKPFFSLHTNRTFATTDRARVWVNYRGVDALDFRVYRVKDPVKFFRGLDNPHQVGEDEKEAVGEMTKRKPNFLERLRQFKSWGYGFIKSYVRAQLQNQSRKGFNQKFRPEEDDTIYRTPLNVATDFAQVPLLNPDQMVSSWREKLPPLEDVEDRRMISLSSTVNHQPGVYLVEAVNGELRAFGIVIVTDIATVEKTTSDGSMFVYAVERNSGQPREGVRVQVIRGKEDVTTGATDNRGLLNLKIPLKKPAANADEEGGEGDEEAQTEEEGTAEAQYNDSYLVMATEGENFAISDLESYYFGGYGDEEGGGDESLTSYIYTDRPVYRPEQKVYFKGILRERTDAGYKIPAGRMVSVTVTDDEGSNIYEKELPLSTRGTFTGELDLPEEAPLGNYNINASIADSSASGYFQVEEYKKPEYKVRVTTPNAFVHTGEKTKFTVSANYYFGSPVTHATVKYYVYRSRYYGWWRDEENSDDEFGADPTAEEGGGDETGGYGDEMVLEGDGKLNPQGQLDIEYKVPDADPKDTHDSSYRVEAQVTDAARRTMDGGASFTGVRSNTVAYASPERYVYYQGDTAHINVKAGDHEGRPVETRVKLTFFERRWLKVVKKTEDDYEYPDHEVKEKELASAFVDTNQQGEGALDYVVPISGSIQIKTTVEENGKPVVLEAGYLWVSDRNGEWSDVSYEGEDDIKLVADKKSYRVGETAHVLALLPKEKAHLLVTTELSSVMDVRQMDVPGRAAIIDVKIEPRFSPNIYLSVTYVRKSEMFTQSLSISVPARDKFLNLQIIPNKKEFKPRETASYTVLARNSDGSPAANAEISVGVVDEAIYQIEPETVGDIRRTFYDKRYNSVQTSFSANYYFSGYAGTKTVQLASNKRARQLADFKNQADLVNPQVRRIFKDTAFWQPASVTGADGKVTVKFELPDNLTTWRATARGVTADTRVGTAVERVVERKDVIIRVASPRFLTAGDTVTLSGIVHNYLKADKVTKITINVGGARLLDAPTQTVTIPSQGEYRVNWRVNAPASGDLKIYAEARTNEESDALETGIPIVPRGLKNTRGDSFAIADDDADKAITFTLPANADPNARTLRVEASPSIAGALFGALDYLTSFPYGCTEQTMSSFLPNVIVTQALQNVQTANISDKNDIAKKVRRGMRRLYAYQHGDGGWGWWKDDPTTAWMTAYVVDGLVQARRAGYEVEDERLERGRAALRKMLEENADGSNREMSLDERPYMAYALAESGDGEMKYLNDLFANRGKLGAYGRALLALGLLERADTRRAQTVAAEIERAAKSGGADAQWDNNVEATALSVKALARLAPQSEILPKAARWLVQHRRFGYYWLSTRETAFAIFGLIDYLKVSHELEADYSLEVYVNGQQVLQHQMTAADASSAQVFKIERRNTEVGATNEVRVVKHGRGMLYLATTLVHYTNDEQTPEQGVPGLKLHREYMRLSVVEKEGGDLGWQVEPLTGDVHSGDIIVSRLRLDGDKGGEYLLIEDPIPAGCEQVEEVSGINLNHDEKDWSDWYSSREFRDNRSVLFVEYFDGHAQFQYAMRVQEPGQFRVAPARVERMYEPDVRANSASAGLTILDK
jgi:uncharacterized protein YfaS (alpha-2-macroglobulin family)